MKYSFKNDTTKSSVIVLRDGRALEIRRGEKTSFSADERQTWPTLDEWMATLPDGASVKVSKGKKTGTGKPRPVVTNPVLVRFLERVRAACHDKSIRRETMLYAGTRAEIIHAEKGREEKEFAEGWKTWVTPAAHERVLAVLDARLAAQVEGGTADKPVFRVPRRGGAGTGSYITMADDGEMRMIRYNQARNVIGYFLNDGSICGAWDVRFLSTDFVELTDPEMPMWRLVHGGAPVKIH
jgi:hypothetical protein